MYDWSQQLAMVAVSARVNEVYGLPICLIGTIDLAYRSHLR